MVIVEGWVCMCEDSREDVGSVVRIAPAVRDEAEGSVGQGGIREATNEYGNRCAQGWTQREMKQSGGWWWQS